MSMSSDLRALSDAVSYEYSVIFGYGVISAVISGTYNASIAQAWAGHRARRDRVMAFMESHNATPPLPELAYTTLQPVWNDMSALHVASHMEEECTIAWATALQQCETREARALALEGVLTCTEWCTRWRSAAKTEPLLDPLPGLQRTAAQLRKTQSAGTSPAAQHPTLSSPRKKGAHKHTPSHQYREPNDLSGYQPVESSSLPTPSSHTGQLTTVPSSSVPSVESDSPGISDIESVPTE